VILHPVKKFLLNAYATACHQLLFSSLHFCYYEMADLVSKPCSKWAVGHYFGLKKEVTVRFSRLEQEHAIYVERLGGCEAQKYVHQINWLTGEFPTVSCILNIWQPWREESNEQNLWSFQHIKRQLQKWLKTAQSYERKGKNGKKWIESVTFFLA